MRIRVAECPAGCGDAVSVLGEREPKPCMACRLKEVTAEAAALRSESAELRRERDDFGDELAMELQSTKEDLAKCGADRALMGALLDWVGRVAKGEEVCDFGESHGIVRAVMDLRARAEAAEAEIARLRKRVHDTLVGAEAGIRAAMHVNYGGYDAREESECARAFREGVSDTVDAVRRALAGEKGGV